MEVAGIFSVEDQEVADRAEHFLPCAITKALTYALGRPAASDATPTRVDAAWALRGRTLSALWKSIVFDDAFRTRRPRLSSNPRP